METLISRELARQAAHAADALDEQYQSEAEVFIRQVSTNFVLGKTGNGRRSTLSVGGKIPLSDSEEDLSDETVPTEPARNQSDGALFHSKHGKELEDHLTKLAAAFRARSLHAKEIISRPPAADHHEVPETQAERPQTTVHSQSTPNPASVTHLKSSSLASELPLPVIVVFGKIRLRVPEVFFKIPRPPAVDPLSKRHLAWLGLTSLAFLYNAIVIPYRATFPVQTADNVVIWLSVDYFSDLIYLADLLIWKMSVKNKVYGIEESSTREICRTYVTTTEFRLDLFSLTPLDLFYLISSVEKNPLLRLLRLLRLHSYWEFMNRVDQILTNPYYLRVMRTFAYMLYIIHINACLFYYFSLQTGFDAEDSFVHNNVHQKCLGPVLSPRCNNPGQYNDYIFCFFFSVSMITIIGNVNIPARVWEMLYSAVLWLVGVFVFATLVGQIRDVLRAKSRQEDEFYEVLNVIMDHMQTLHMPKDLQLRVRSWLLYNWEEQGTTDESKLLDGLPVRLRTEIAMEVHYSTIHKVQLFRHMDKKVVEKLLLRLCPTVYLPGDYICQIGEIGKEMFIVKSGLLEVVLPDGCMAVTLGPGSVFGEISLLALAGGNRRTANVRSKGFSTLYVLKKTDLNEVMADYPEQMETLKAKAQELLNKGKPVPESSTSLPPVEVIHSRPSTPEMVRVALSVLKGNSPVTCRLNYPRCRLTSVDPLETESDADRPQSLYVEFLKGSGKHNPFSKSATGHGAQSNILMPESVELQDRSRSSVFDMGSVGSSPLVPPRKRFRTRSRLWSRSPQNVDSAERHSSESDADSETSLRLRPVLSGRRYEDRTLPLTCQDAEEPEAASIPAQHPQALEEKMRSWSARGLFQSSNLRHLQHHLFRQPKISPLQLDQAELVATKDQSGVYNFGAVSNGKIGDNALPRLLSSDIDDFRLSDSYDNVVFSSPDSP